MTTRPGPPVHPAPDLHPRTALHRRMVLENYGAAAFLVVCALVAVPQWYIAVALGPSLILGALCLIIGWQRRPSTPVMAAGIAVGGATLAWDVVAAGAAGGSLGVALSGGVWACWLPKWRAAAAGGLATVIVAASCGVLLRPQPYAERAAWTMSVMAVMAVFSVFFTRRHWELICELDRAGRTEQEVALLRERERFAADLHDIQGHTLHAIKLKAALARKVLDTSPDQARAELSEISHLATRTINEGRQLARATHRLDVATELANAVALLEAAGIRVTTVPDAVPRLGVSIAACAERDAWVSLVLREATTNILRHSRAREVSITANATGLTIRNDGAGAGAPLRGLADLRQRLRDAGGELSIKRQESVFALTVTFPASGAR